jgi:hypothetical protein
MLLVAALVASQHSGSGSVGCEAAKKRFTRVWIAPGLLGPRRTSLLVPVAVISAYFEVVGGNQTTSGPTAGP